MKSSEAFVRVYEIKLTKNIDRILKVGEDVFMAFSYHYDKESQVKSSSVALVEVTSQDE